MNPSASAFVLSAPLSSATGASSFVQAGTSCHQLASNPCVVVPPARSRAPLRMVTVSRPSFKSTSSFSDDHNDGGLRPDPALVGVESVDAPAPPTAPEVVAAAAAVCEFMNTERVRDIANYVVRFGRKFVSR